MRLWSIHPAYLDSKGLVALWRETLLAQKVLAGETSGYRNHPQLQRFKNTRNPMATIATYLRTIAEEAERRGYRFDSNKIGPGKSGVKINVTSGQVAYEFRHLLQKLQLRDPELYQKICNTKRIRLHPLFERVRGDIESWEIVK